MEQKQQSQSDITISMEPCPTSQTATETSYPIPDGSIREFSRARIERDDFEREQRCSSRSWIAEVDSEAEPTEAEISAQKISYVYDNDDQIIQISLAQPEDGV